MKNSNNEAFSSKRPVFERERSLRFNLFRACGFKYFSSEGLIPVSFDDPIHLLLRSRMGESRQQNQAEDENS